MLYKIVDFQKIILIVFRDTRFYKILICSKSFYNNYLLIKILLLISRELTSINFVVYLSKLL